MIAQPPCIYILGGSSGHGIESVGQGTGSGIYASSTGTGSGLLAVGGATSGPGITASGYTNSPGLKVAGVGTGVGILISTSSTDALNVNSNSCINDSGVVQIVNVANSINGFTLPIPKNTALPDFVFAMRNSVGNPVNNLTITSTRIIDGGASSPTTNTATYIAGSEGLYIINLAAADLNGDVINLNFDGGASAVVQNVTIVTCP